MQLTLSQEVVDTIEASLRDNLSSLQKDFTNTKGQGRQVIAEAIERVEYALEVVADYNL
jgi:hypothetical protein